MVSPMSLKMCASVSVAELASCGSATPSSFIIFPVNLYLQLTRDPSVTQRCSKWCLLKGPNGLDITRTLNMTVVSTATGQF